MTATTLTIVAGIQVSGVVGGIALASVGIAWMLDAFGLVTAMRNLHERQLMRKTVDPKKPAYLYRAAGIFFLAMAVVVVVGAL
jgi:hypothetical protein